MPVPSPPPVESASVGRRALVSVLVALLVVSLALFAWREAAVLLQGFAGILFALLLVTMSDWVSRHTGLGYRRAVALVIVGALVVIVATVWLFASRLASQVEALTQQLPEALARIREAVAASPWGHSLVRQAPGATEAWAQLGDFSHLFGFVSGLAGIVVTGIVVLFVGIFGASEPDLYRAGFLHLVPPSFRPRAEQSIDAVVYNLRWWLFGQVCAMVIMGVTTTIGLWIIGIPLALTLGLIAGILEGIPFVGPWLAAVPAVLVALLVGPWQVLLTIGLYFTLQLLEGNLLQPMIQRRAVLLPPALTLMMQVLFGDLFGFMGLLVAAPLTVVAVVLLKMLYVEDTLGDQGVRGPGEPGKT